MSEGAPAVGEPPGAALLALRAASRRLDGPAGPEDLDAGDAAADAERFEALHEALAAVLDDLDRG